MLEFYLLYDVHQWRVCGSFERDFYNQNIKLNIWREWRSTYDINQMEIGTKRKNMFGQNGQSLDLEAKHLNQYHYDDRIIVINFFTDFWGIKTT